MNERELNKAITNMNPDEIYRFYTDLDQDILK